MPRQLRGRGLHRPCVEGGGPLGVLRIDPERHRAGNPVSMTVQDGPVDVEQAPGRRGACCATLAEVVCRSGGDGRLGKALWKVEVPQGVVSGQGRAWTEHDGEAVVREVHVDGVFEKVGEGGAGQRFEVGIVPERGRRGGGEDSLPRCHAVTGIDDVDRHSLSPQSILQLIEQRRPRSDLRPIDGKDPVCFGQVREDGPPTQHRSVGWSVVRQGVIAAWPACCHELAPPLTACSCYD